MALIVEDGTGKATAESYCTVAEATTYHTNRGNSSWNDVIELMTLDVAPSGAGWAIGDTITGATSAKTCVIVERLTTLTYHVKNRSGGYTLGEILSNGTATADQGAANPTFAATDAIREQWLRKATEFMIQAYTSRWQGLRVYPLVQALDWPRQGVIVDGVSVLTTIVPEVIKRATAELALKAAAGALYEDLTQGVTSETVGAISVTYDKTSNRKTKYTAVEAMLQPYLKSGGNVSMGLVRT
jgi:hypothetical protein